jgi:hypothetical protein
LEGRVSLSHDIFNAQFYLSRLSSGRAPTCGGGNGNDLRILQVVWEALSDSYTYSKGLVSNNPIRQTSPSGGEAEPFYGFLQEIIDRG